jgi:hypothetical protein
MKGKLVLFFLLISAGAAFGAISFQQLIIEGGKVTGIMQRTTRLQTEIDPEQYQYPLDYEFPDAPTKYWKFDGTDWVEMTDEEKYQVDHGHKSTEQKTYENGFFALTEELLTLTEDERAGQEPPVKLGFPEIQTLIEAIQATDPMAAVNFSLKLLTIDAALKRYDTLWWDNAATHELE